MTDFTLVPAIAADFDDLLWLRLRAMRASLEALGRYDHMRARQRFVDNFKPEYCHHIVVNGHRIGCVAVRPEGEGLQLDMLYIHPSKQGQGWGTRVLQYINEQADRDGKSIKVEVLKGSPANAFYQQHGYVHQYDGEWDHYYLRQPARMAA